MRLILLLFLFISTNCFAQCCKSVDSFLRVNTYAASKEYFFCGDINSKDTFGNTILTKSILIGNFNLFKWAMNKDANPFLTHHNLNAFNCISFPNVSDPCKNETICKNQKVMIKMLKYFYQSNKFEDSLITSYVITTAIKHLPYKDFKKYYKSMRINKNILNIVDSNQNSLLHQAIQYKSYSNAIWLIRNQCRIAKNKDGLYPQDLLPSKDNCLSKECKNIYQLLNEYNSYKVMKKK